MGKLKNVADKSARLIRDEGPANFTKRAARYAYYRQFPHKKKKLCKDILFINGCSLPHPSRYRVDHQVEQLMAAGLTADSVFYEQLDLAMLKYYRGFVFFRCPVTDTVESFIAQAKKCNKRCFYDIDDLVIDSKYTDQIKYVRSLKGAEKELYDDGVRRMGRTLALCDYAITTTERLQSELQHYSEEVYINRNTASDEMIRHSVEAYKTTKRNDDHVVLGYFSGSITHNEDFEMIMPSIIKVLERHENVYLKLAGLLDIPPELQPYADRISTVGFVDWRQLPFGIAACDINLAPLTETIFNEAKSENKWTEAALVHVPTIASNLGAFKKVIDPGATGILAEPNEWYEAISDLITDREKRIAIGAAAYQDAVYNHSTVNASYGVAEFIRQKLARNIAFVLPSSDISGGVIVAFKHAEMLRNAGWDVTIIDAIHKKSLEIAKKEYDYRLDIPGFNMILQCQTKVECYFDSMVATLWSTVKDIKSYPNVAHRLYLVQNFETDFYTPGSGEPKFLANATYNDRTGIRYITISLWCRRWLKEIFGQNARYASNGIDLSLYHFRERAFEGKIKLLVEGDSKSEYKNTDEAFRIIQKLDPAKYEVSYLSYRKEPKDWYRVDHFYNRISPDKVGDVYASCDILIKTSVLESFSYPPLEMMATGGLSVVLPNEGNAEYLADGENCLLYTPGDTDDGARKVEQLVHDKELRDRLIANGRETAQKYAWQNVESAIIALYE